MFGFAFVLGKIHMPKSVPKVNISSPGIFLCDQASFGKLVELFPFSCLSLICLQWIPNALIIIPRNYC